MVVMGFSFGLHWSIDVDLAIRIGLNRLRLDKGQLTHLVAGDAINLSNQSEILYSCSLWIANAYKRCWSKYMLNSERKCYVCSDARHTY